MGLVVEGSAEAGLAAEGLEAAGLVEGWVVVKVAAGSAAAERVAV